MKRSLITLGFAISIAVAGLSTHEAKAGEGFYVGAHGGGNWMSAIDNTFSSPGISSTVALEQGNGYVVGGSAGYAWKNGLRAEGEVTYRRNSITGFNASAVVAGIPVTGSGAAVGNISNLAFMANGYYGVNITDDLSLYAGGGVGAAILKVDGFRGVNGTATFTDSKTVFAFQAIAGTAYMLSRNISLGVEYRFFGTSGTDFDDNVGGTNVNVAADGARNHSIMVNLKYYFSSGM